jgi:hypothetical protein
MKSTIKIMVAALLCSTCALAQKEVPAAAKANFSKSYPGVHKVKWDKEEGKYEASFKQNGKKMSVLYTVAGTPEETETAISVAELPAAARTYAAGKGKIKEAAKIVSATGVVKYEAEVKGADLLFDADGKFLEEKKEPANDKH